MAVERVDRKKELLRLGMILLGNGIVAFGVTAFIAPNGLITGGTTGLGLFGYYQLGLPISWTVSACNLVLFCLGAWFMGKRFAANTLLSSIVYPLELEFFQRFPVLSGLTDDMMLMTLYSGVCVGVGVGLVLRTGASTGGMDIPPLIFHKKFGLPVSVGMYACDTTILLLQAFSSDSEQILYGLVVVLISSLVINRVLVIGKGRTRVEIISQKSEELNRMIQETLDRGSTLIESETGHLHRKQKIVMTVLGHRDLPRLTQMVQEIDREAFMVVSQVNEVHGRGFTFGRYTQL